MSLAFDDMTRSPKHRTAFIGIDVGNAGAIAAIIEGSPIPAMFDMPVIERVTGTKKKPVKRKVIDVAKLRKILCQLRDVASDIYAVVETPQLRSPVRPAEPATHNCNVCRSVHLTINQGTANQGSFMRAGGIIVGLLAGLGIGYEEVTPAVWMAEVFNAKTEKIDHRKLAIALFPAARSLFERVKDDGRAEATLLADWLRRRHNAPF